MDNKFRIGGKVSIIDIMIFIILISGIFFLYRLSTPTVINGGNKIEKKYTIEIYNVKGGFSDNVEIGRKIYDSLKGTEIGTIVDVYSENTQRLSPNLIDNIYNITDSDDFENTYIVVSSNVDINDNSTTVNDYEVMVGKAVYVKSKDFAGSGYIVKLDR